jgi:AAA+ superfamily predicted ATPase
LNSPIGDLMDSTVDIDRRMLDYIVGLDCEFSEIVEGSQLYFPKVKLENVILPDEHKNLILSTVSNYEIFKSFRKKFGFDELLSYGKGVVLLFHGDSGTGKTMLANALANRMGKKILLINFGHIGDTTGQILKFIFREAKINDALLFFDECEVFFETRNKMGSEVNALLTEVERHDGLIIMATNRAFDIDQAMHRRITLAIEFKSPDSILRKQIWLKHIPPEMKIDSSVDFEKLAMNYELTGGLIKNSVLSALNFAVSKNPEDPIITQEDLIQGAQLQLRGQLELNEFDKKIIPTHSLSELVVSKKIKETFQDIISFEKARKILLSQWGFEMKNSRQGTTILIHGSSGTGKSFSIEAIGYECGLPLKVINLHEVLTKYAYNTTKNIQTLFNETKKVGAILVLEVMEENYKIDDSVNLLLHHIEHFSGIVILVISSEKLIIEPSMKQKFKFVIEFEKPDSTLRKELWKKMIPKKTPISNDIDFDILSEFEFTGGNINDVIFRAAARAALEVNGKLSMSHLTESAKKEMELIKQSSKTQNMYY